MNDVSGAVGDGRNVPQVAQTPFSVNEFTLGAAGSHRSNLALEEYEANPLHPEILRALRYLWDVERSTMTQMRDVLVTYTHKEARITAFLTTWAYEKYWIAEALKAVLAEHGQVLSEQVIGDGDLLHRAESLIEQLTPISDALWTNLAGEPVAALQMTRGALQEKATIYAYLLVSQRTDNPELSRMLTQFIDQKAAYLEFFEAEATSRIDGSKVGAELARAGLKGTWSPLRPIGVSRREYLWFVDTFLSGETRHQLVDEIDAFALAHFDLGGNGPLRRSLRRNVSGRIARANDALAARGGRQSAQLSSQQKA